ncbi:MAG TPA: Kdo hydroxylase family protein [Terracidiphilus sp.]
MPVHSIFPNALNPARLSPTELNPAVLNPDTLKQIQPSHRDQALAWCAWLETGNILYFPQTPVPVPTADLDFLLGQFQTGSRLHKNISYRPARDKLSGVEAKTATSETRDQLRAVMRRYSASVAGYLTQFLAPYEQRWLLDYASCRPIEEEGRDLPLHRRNDLLHTDAFPTRPTRGHRILRFFHNIHPSRTRDWVVGGPFSRIVADFAPAKVPLPQPDGTWTRLGKRLAGATGLAMLLPQWKRTPYDEFMRRMHNAMKEDEHFQRSCAREYFQFAPGSSWVVYTDMVAHAVLAGQFALEQTFLVDPAVMVMPESAPLAVLEKMSGARLV